MGGSPGHSPAEAGRALAVVGDYGSGKTHLAIGIRETSAEFPDAKILAIDASQRRFGYLYRNTILDMLGKADVRDLVTDYFSEVVASTLDEIQIFRTVAPGIAAGLRERTIDPEKVVASLHLSAPALQNDLRRRLRTEVEYAKFGRALALMATDRYADAVWEWLSGEPPAEELRALGVRDRIASDLDAYDALSVLTFLYGRKNRRVVLIVDEYEKLLGHPGEWNVSSVNAFEQLIKVFIDVGGLLVFCGMPESLYKLPQSIHQRIGITRLSPLTADETLRLLRKRRSPGQPDVSLEIADYIRALTGGVPRMSLTLHRRAVDLAEEQGSELITPAIVRAAVRRHYERASMDYLLAAIRRLIEAGGWDFHTDVMLDENTTIDFWLSRGEGGAGVAVLTSSSLLRAEDVEGLREQIEAVRVATPSAEIIVVVNGYVSTTLQGAISHLIGRQPVVFDEARFGDDFRTVTHNAVRRLDRGERGYTLESLSRNLERLSLQQSSTQSMLEALSGSVGSLHSSLAARATGEEAPRSLAPALPPPVAEHFDRALASVSALGTIDAGLRAGFADPAGAGARLRRRLASRELFEAVGVAVLLRRLVETFRDRVADYIQTVRLAGGHLPVITRAQEEELRLICRTYEATAEALPLLRLDSLALTAPSAPTAGPVELATRARHRSDAVSALGGLSQRVFEAVTSSLRG
ncbi:hypothetical protein [Spongiactinospora sp. TRM90649]|uniref:hypothetical protein n=1 Tax=Spongiactinospora sp. TRM90649 TaxID=3031114 RepID=UPI0023F9FD50|nr:hypothetical protein [Spongiactinospora sp. TRM90649]MDF5758187.1 hypothetical protein [Spongiactinospora sp. TRM90649]